LLESRAEPALFFRILEESNSKSPSATKHSAHVPQKTYTIASTRCMF